MRRNLLVSLLLCRLLSGTGVGSEWAPTLPPDAVQAPLPSEVAPLPPDPAAAAATLDLAQLEAMALSNNPTLAQARARIAAARGNCLQSGLYPNPAISYVGEEIGNEGSAGLQGAMVGQELVTAGKLRLNRAVASQDVVRAERELDAQQYRVLSDVRGNFYRALVAQRRVDLAEKLVQVAEQGVTTARTLYETAEVSQVDVLQTRIQLNSTRILLTNARSIHEGSAQALAAVVGVPNLANRRLAGDIDIGDLIAWEEALARILANSPEMGIAASQVDRARWALGRACAGRIPNVNTAASVLEDTMTDDAVASVQIGIAVPIFDRNQGNILSAQANIVDAQRNLERVRLALQSRLADVYQQYASARSQVEEYRNNILPDASTTLDLVRVGYQQGEFGYLNLLSAQRTYFQSEWAYLDALLQLKAAEVVIRGLLLSDSLQAQSMAAAASNINLDGMANQPAASTGIMPGP